MIQAGGIHEVRWFRLPRNFEERLGNVAGPVLGKPVEARQFLVIFLPVAALLTAAFALGRGEVFVSPFDLNVEQGRVEEPLKPILRVGAPVFGEGGGKNRRCLGKQRNR